MCRCHEALWLPYDAVCRGTHLQRLPRDIIRYYISPMAAAPDITYIYHREPEKDAIATIYPDCPAPTCEDARYSGQLRIWRRHGITFVASWDECAAYRHRASGYELIDRTPVEATVGCCLYPAGMFIANPHDHFAYKFEGNRFIRTSFSLIEESKTNHVLQSDCGTTIVTDTGVPSRAYNMRVDPPVYIETACDNMGRELRFGLNFFYT